MKKILVLIMVLTLCVGCQNKKLETYSNTSIDAGFDTFITIQAQAESQEKFDEIFTISIDKFKELNQYFDIYHTYEGVNNLKTINDQAGIAPVEVDQSIIDMLNVAKEFYDLSDGELDITMGALLKVWHKYREEGLLYMNEGEFGRIPSLEELEAAKACSGWNNIEIDDEKNTVYINNPCVSLDVGGIAKGFAAESIATELESIGVTTGVVNAGGNTRTIGTKQGDKPWRVQIENPEANGTTLVVESKGTASFVTSGDYQRYYIAEDGKFYHHIIDPRTNFPADHFHSVTIITPNSAVADALSTTLFTLPYEEGLALINKYNNEHPDAPVSAVWLMDPNQEVLSENTMMAGNYLCVYTDNLKDSIELITK
ncbi:MAG: FAD:protein FMN transferase [Longicatena sp.]|uniref:FAD:protein FMN transferase n=1 Tax=Anaerorhabdus sp. TaxID=1872524 RepID=UPI002FC9050F